MNTTKDSAREGEITVPLLQGMDPAEDEICPRALMKQETRSLAWLSFSKTRKLLSLAGLSHSEAPSSNREATGYFLYINKVEGWHVSAGLLSIIANNKTELKYSISISFYHGKSQRFFGGTAMGQQVEGLNSDELLKRREETNATLPASTPPAPVVLHVTHDEILYWFSRVADQDCVAILELVANEIEPSYGVTINQYACGWTVLRPFGNPSLKDATEEDEESKLSFEMLPVYRGTPRHLVFFTDQDWADLKGRAIPGCTISIKLREFHRLLRAMHLFNENEVMSAIDLIPGLEKQAVRMPNGNKISQAPILGAEIGWRGSARNAAPVVSPARPLLALTFSVTFHDLAVLVPSRSALEQDLLRSITSELPSLAKEVPVRRSLGMTMTMGGTMKRKTMLVDEVAAEDRRATIVSRFLKVGVHNGRCLVRQAHDEEWVYLKLDEMNENDYGEPDLLSHVSAKESKLINYVKHPYCALVFMLEYSVRLAPKKKTPSLSQEGRRASSRAEIRENQIKEEATSSRSSLLKVPIVLGTQVLCPFDGKRLRLRNLPRGSDPPIELQLLPDETCRVLTTDLVFMRGRNESMFKTMQLEEPIALGLNMVVRDSAGNEQRDETPPTDAEESDVDVAMKRKEAEEVKGGVSEGSSGSASSSEEQEEETEEGEQEEEEEKGVGLLGQESESSGTTDSSENVLEVTTRKRDKDKHKPKLAKRLKRKRRRVQEEDASEAESEEEPLSLIEGNPFNSYMRRCARHRRKSERPSLSDLSEFEDWRGGIRVPGDKQSLLAQSLRANLQRPARPMSGLETAAPKRDLPPPEPRVVYAGVGKMPQASALPADELSRASRARLGRYGFTDIMREGSGAVVLPQGQRDVMSIEVELADELQRHEITLQFAAIRIAHLEDKFRAPNSIFFNFSFYHFPPTTTEPALLRVDTLGDTLTHILVRESRFGRDAPAKAYRFVIDTGPMQEAEVRSFLDYMVSANLHIDLWDAESLMLLGNLSLPLWRLMRQGNPVSKFASELEVKSPLDGHDNSHGGITVDTGHHRSRVFAYVQLLACNYGENTQSSGAPPPSIEIPLTSFSPDMSWRFRYRDRVQAGVESVFLRKDRPHCRVRARPLSETSREAASLLDLHHLGSRVGNVGREGARLRAAADDRSITYDELTLLFRRFRGPGRSQISYRERLIDLLCVTSVQALETKFVRLVTRAEENGASLEEIFAHFDRNKDGCISLAEFEDGLKRVEGIKVSGENSSPGKPGAVTPFCAPLRKRLRPIEVRILLKRFEGKAGLDSIDLKRQKSGQMTELRKVDLRKFIKFIRVRQPTTNVEIKFKRILAKADLAGFRLNQLFTCIGDVNEDREISVAEFRHAIGSLGSLASSLSSTDIDKLTRKLDLRGNGRISLEAITRISGVSFQVTAQQSQSQQMQTSPSRSPGAAVKQKLQDIFRRAKEEGLSVEYAFKHFDKEGTGLVSEFEFEQGLRQLNVFEETDEALHAAVRAWAKRANDAVSWRDFLEWVGESDASPEDRLEHHLIGLCIKVQDTRGDWQTVMETFETDNNELVSLDKFVIGLRSLEKSYPIVPSEAQHLIRRWNADSEKGDYISRETLSAAVQAKVERVRKQIQVKKRQVTLAHLRDAAVRILRKEGGELSKITPSVICASVKRSDKGMNMIDADEFGAALAGVGLAASSNQASKPGNTLTTMAEAISAFGDAEMGVSLTAFDTWWQRTVLPTLSPYTTFDQADVSAQRKMVHAAGEISIESRHRAESYGSKDGDEAKHPSNLRDEGSKAASPLKGNDDARRMIVHGKDRRREEEDADSEEARLDLYKYSKDLETREVEQKVRRRSRLLLQQGVDIEEMLKELDPDDSGCIQRADFLTLLMELGISLVDGPGSNAAQGPSFAAGSKVRDRQLAQIAALYGRPRSSKRQSSDRPPVHLFSHISLDSDDKYQEQIHESEEALALIKLYRDNLKRQSVRAMLLKSVRTLYRIFPRQGDMAFFEFPFRNPFPHEERFKISIADPAYELRVVLSSEEWSYLRKCKRPAVGKLWPFPIMERDMIDSGGENGAQLVMAGEEELPIPFCFISCSPPVCNTTQCKAEQSKEKQEQTSSWTLAGRMVEVAFISASHGNMVVQLAVEIHLQPLIVDRVLHFYQGEREILRRCVRFIPDQSMSALADYEDCTKYVHCIEPIRNTRRSAVVEWRHVDGATEEVLIKYLCGSFPEVGTFYLLIYKDYFQANLHEVWRVNVHYRITSNVHSFLGQSTCMDLTVGGDRYARRVKCYSSAPTVLNLGQSSTLKLTPGSENKIQVRYRPPAMGQELIHVHAVDTETNELVAAWLISATAKPPTITKTYDVDLPFAQPGHKKIAYTNPWDRPRFYELVSSDENLMRARYTRIEVPPQEKAYLRLYFPAQKEMGARKEVYLFINDEKGDQNEECFLVRMRVVEV